MKVRGSYVYIGRISEVIARAGKVKKIMPAAFAELQGDFLYMLTTPSREEMEQMIEDFGKKA